MVVYGAQSVQCLHSPPSPSMRKCCNMHMLEPIPPAFPEAPRVTRIILKYSFQRHGRNYVPLARPRLPHKRAGKPRSPQKISVHLRPPPGFCPAAIPIISSGELSSRPKEIGRYYRLNTLTTPSPPADTTQRPSWLHTTEQTPSPRMIL